MMQNIWNCILRKKHVFFCKVYIVIREIKSGNLNIISSIGRAIYNSIIKIKIHLYQLLIAIHLNKQTDVLTLIITTKQPLYS